MALTKIQAAGLTADLIDETKLADNSIDSEHYNDGSIDNAHLADDAVGVAELSATGTASSSTFLRGDNSWVTPTDTNTTYTAGTGLNLSGTEFSVTSLALTTVQEAANQTAMLALTTQEGDVVVRTDENKSYVKNSGSAGNMNDFTLLRTPTDAVLSVNGNTGAISAAQISAAVGSAGVDFNDDVKARFGTGNDLELYHVGSGPYSVIRQNDGPLYIQTDDTTNGIQLGTYTDGETMAKFIKNGAVELYHDNVLRAQTTAHGFQAFGNLTIRDNVIFYIGDGNDLQIKHDSTTNNSSIANSTGQLNIAGADVRITNAAQTESQLIATENGAVELYHDNVKKAETYNQGLKCFNHCRIEGGEGEAATLALYADEADDSDDQFMLASNGSMLTILGQYDSGWHRYLSVTPNGGVQLYYDQLDSGNPTPKFESTSTGAKVTGQLDIPDGSGSDGANHIRIGNSFDLRIYHDGTDSYVANVTNKLRLTSPEVRIENSGATEVMAKFIQNGACDFRYDDSVRLETMSTGIVVKGAEGASGEIDLYADEGDDAADKWKIQATAAGALNIYNNDGNWQERLTMNASGGTLHGTWTGAGGDNKPAFSAYTSSTFDLASDTWVKQLFQTEEFDSDSAYDASTSTFTVPSGKGGKYQLNTQVSVDDINQGAYLTIGLYINGSLQSNRARSYDWSPDSDKIITCSMNNVISLSAGDTVNIYALHSGTGTQSSENHANWFSMFRLAGV